VYISVLDFLTIISNAAPIDKVDHFTLSKIAYRYEPGKQEHTEGSSKLLTFDVIII